VTDAETPIDQLVYTWSVAPPRGTFSGTGRQVTWTSPHLQQTPDTYTITLNVTENFTGADGLPRQNKADPKSAIVHYNDSDREIRTLGNRYLTQLFPDYSVGPDQAVQDFSNSCPGKAAERSDVADNRRYFHILSGTYTNTTVTFLDPGRTSAKMVGTCVFRDIPQDRSNPNYGKIEIVTGKCTLGAIYENWQWYLCSSDFGGIST